MGPAPIAALVMADEQPITPHAGPILDPSGLLSYVGDDGRRYLVGTPADLAPHRDSDDSPGIDDGEGPAPLSPDRASADRVMRDLRQANRLYRRIESLCRDWITAVQSRDLERGAALELLLTTLETTLDDTDCATDPSI